MTTIKLLEHIDHVAKVFIVTALVRGNCYCVCIFLNCSADNIGNAAIVAQGDNRCALPVALSDDLGARLHGEGFRRVMRRATIRV